MSSSKNIRMIGGSIFDITQVSFITEPLGLPPHGFSICFKNGQYAFINADPENSADLFNEFVRDWIVNNFRNDEHTSEYSDRVMQRIGLSKD